MVPLETAVHVSGDVAEQVKFAATLLLAASNERLQVPVPLHAPDQPANVCVASGVTVSVSGDVDTVWKQLEVQFTPMGDIATVPPPRFVTATSATPVP